MKQGFLSGNALKIIALIAMTIDHIGYILFPDVMWLRAIGRLAFPIYAYFLAEGCRYTKNKLKYFLLIFLLGIVCQIVLYIFSGQTTFNILITFSFSIVLCYALIWLKQAINQNNTKKTIWGWIIFIILIIATYLLSSNMLSFSIITVDYGFWGIMLPVLATISDNKYIKLVFFAIGLVFLSFGYSSLQLFSLLSILLLLFYNGTRGKYNIKYLFYIYYPLHISLIYLIKFLI